VYTPHPEVRFPREAPLRAGSPAALRASPREIHSAGAA
jgi:hypothetical protein